MRTNRTANAHTVNCFRKWIVRFQFSSVQLLLQFWMFAVIWLMLTYSLVQKFVQLTIWRSQKSNRLMFQCIFASIYDKRTSGNDWKIEEEKNSTWIMTQWPSMWKTLAITNFSTLCIGDDKHTLCFQLMHITQYLTQCSFFFDEAAFQALHRIIIIDFGLRSWRLNRLMVIRYSFRQFSLKYCVNTWHSRIQVSG